MTAWKTGAAAVRFVQCLLLALLVAGCGGSGDRAAEEAAKAADVAAAAEAEAKDDCRDRLNAAVRRVSPESLGVQTRRDSVVNALNSWLASCGEADVKALSISDANAALLSETSLRTARAVRFSENDVLYIRDSMLLKGLTESIWKQIPSGTDQANAESRRITALFRHLIRNVALAAAEENRVPVGLYEALLTGRGGVEDRIWAFTEALRQRQIDSLVLQPATPAAASGSFVETAELLVAVLVGSEVLLFDPFRGVPVPRADDTAALPGQPAGLSEISGVERWKSAAVFIPSHPSAAAPRMLVLQQRLDAADALVLYEELAGGTSEIRPFVQRVAGVIGGVWPVQGLRVWPVPEQRVAAAATLDESQRQALTQLLRPFDSPYERESIDLDKMLTDPNIDESKLTKEQLQQMKAEAAAKLLEKSDALFGKPSRRLLLARISQIGGNFELSMIQELQQIRVACLQEVVELSFSIDGKEAVGRLPLPESILSVQRSAVGDTLYWTAMSQFSRGEYGTAVQTFRNHRRQYPEDRNSLSALMNEAECLLEFGDPAGAAAVLAEADTDRNPERLRVQWLRSRLPTVAAEAPVAP